MDKSRSIVLTNLPIVLKTKKLNMETKNEYKGLWIPKYISLNKILKAHEKLILADIIVLYESTGKCFKSNNAFAVLISTSTRQAKRYIKSLQDKGYINTAIQRYSSPIHTSKRYLVPNIKFAKDEFYKLNNVTYVNEEGHKPSSDGTIMAKTGDIDVPQRKQLKKHIDYNSGKVSILQDKSISNILDLPKKEVSKKEKLSNISDEKDWFDELLSGGVKATNWEERNMHPYEPTGNEIDRYGYNTETSTGYHFGKEYKGDEIKKGDKVIIANQGFDTQKPYDLDY